MDNKHNVRSIDRALDLLLALEQTGRPMRLTELAQTTGIHKATSQRLLSVLERRGLVEKDSTLYHLGPATVPLAYAFFQGNNLSKAILPFLQELATTTEETVSLFVRLGFSRVAIQRVEGKHPMRYVLPVGQRLPLYLGAGKVLAAAMPEEELNAMLNQIGEIRTAIGEKWTRETFLDKLRLIREQGYDISFNERTIGGVSVTAPILRAEKNVVEAITIAGSTENITPERIPALTVEVRRAAQAIGEMYASSGRICGVRTHSAKVDRSSEKTE
ncbi:HTH-type transcriptional regulator KipR [Anaerolineae bacterium]|nr:HTH-type transcriptional regulator KipR [Anaerolineae bacterium]